MKKITALLLALVMAVSLCACGGTSSSTDTSSDEESAATTTPEEPKGDPIEIKLCTIDPAAQVSNVILADMIEEISERTDGMVEIQLYTDGQMMVREEGVEAVMSNANVIVVSQSSYLSDYVPVMDAFSVPFLFPNIEVADAFYNGEWFKDLMAESAEKGIHIICADSVTGFRNVIANTPVRNVADVQKLNLRLAGLSGLLAFWENMGANYNVIPFGDIFSSVQSGAIQGYENNAQSIPLTKMYEACDELYFCETRHLMDGYFLICGEGFWQSIPEEYRSVLQDVLGQWGKKTTAALIEESDAAMKELPNYGVTIIPYEEIDVADFQQYATPIIDEIERGDEVVAEIARIQAELK